jgi:hypothetical protein
MSERIARVLLLRGDLNGDAKRSELARFRIRIVTPHERPAPRAHGPRTAAFDADHVRILALDSVNPHGGVGGSFDSDQCAWLIRELERSRGRWVVIASHDGSHTLTSDTHPSGTPPRILGPEMVSILLGHACVIGWVSNTLHLRSGRRHGDVAHGFWEIPGAASGYGAPLAGGLVVQQEERHLHRVITMRGALAGDSGPVWPVPSVSAGRLPARAGDPR